MKAVSLQRMGDLENDLVEAFPNVKFIFTQGVSDINDHDKRIWTYYLDMMVN